MTELTGMVGFDGRTKDIKTLDIETPDTTSDDQNTPDKQISDFQIAATPIDEPAFSCTRRRQIRRQVLGIELFATVALAVSLVIAATAVSIGMARARTLAAVGHSSGDRKVAAAVIFGVMAAGVGGLTAVLANAQPWTAVKIDQD
jgi:hypothetical protein